MLTPPAVTGARAGAVVLALALTLSSAALINAQAQGAEERRPTSRPGSASAASTPNGRTKSFHAPPAYAIATDGDITDLLRRDGKVYVRGSFSRIGPFTGSGMPLDPATGARVVAPAIDGQISVSVADGSGGWYVAGDFESIAGHRYRGLAHLGADGIADPAFAPKVGGLVSALAIDGDTLYVGGLFDEVNGASRTNLAAVSTETGALTPFLSSRPARVTELLHADSRLYVGDESGLVAVDPTTGAPDAGFTAPVSGPVRALAAAGSHLYVGGRGLVDLDTDTGELQPSFRPTTTQFGKLDGRVHALLVVGEQLYAGGDFRRLGGLPGPLVALSPQDGTADPAFTPAIGGVGHGASDRGVFDLATLGDDLWVGGLFTSAGGSPAQNLAAVDPLTGARHTKSLASLDGQVNTVEASAGGLYVGGQFFMAGWVPARGMAALDGDSLLPLTGFRGQRVSPWGSMVDGKRAIFVAKTNFHGYDKSGDRGAGRPSFFSPSRSKVRAVDPTTGAVIKRLGIDKVQNLTGITTLGDRYYVAQRLDNDVRFPRNRVTAYSQKTGRVVGGFLLPLRGYITELSSADGHLLFAGSFRRVRANGQRAHLALLKVRPRSGGVRQGFDPQTNGPIYDISRQGREIYVAGIFDNAGYQDTPMRGLAKYSTLGGYPSLAKGWRAPAHRLSHHVGVDALGDVIHVSGGGADLFLSAMNGKSLTDPFGGYERQVRLAVREPGGIAYAGQVYLPLGGDSFYRLSYVSRTAD
ncbi:MAG: hypothetical protein Q8O61_19625 [Nocardioides sp.]|nr:hypothetical protein [Nocardioides sp.]